MELDQHQRDELVALFETFDDRDVPYVVLRGYRDLPRVLGGSDLDLLVAADAFETATDVCAARFEPLSSPVRSGIRLIAQGLVRPLTAIRFVLGSPRDSMAFVRRRLSASASSDSRYVERAFGDGDLVVHLANHLAYTSTLDGSPIRVQRPVETEMLSRRVKRGPFFTPAPPDELAHLICRGVYDYGGDFPQRYESHCETLATDVLTNERRDAQFRKLLSLLFYEADSLVYDLVEAGEFDAIRERLARYSDY